MTEQIVIRHADGLILYRAPSGAPIDLAAAPAIVGSLLVGDPLVNAATCYIASGVTLPDDFEVGNYTYAAQGGLALTAAGEAAKGAQLIAAITAKLEALGAYGLARARGGTTVSGFHYDTDSQSRSDLGNAYQVAGTASSPATFDWWMSNGWHAIPKAQIIADAPVVGAWYEAVFTNLKVHYAAIAALATLQAIAAYDYTTGWPAGT